MHGTDGRTVSIANPLHGGARAGKPLRLHGAARTGEGLLHCCAELHSPANHNLQPILQPTAPLSNCKVYLTETLTTNLEVLGPPCMSCTGLHQLEDQLCCTELHGMSGVNHCMELHGTHAEALQVSHGCMSLHDSFLTTQDIS